MSTVQRVLNKIRWLLDASILDEENFRFWYGILFLLNS